MNQTRRLQVRIELEALNAEFAYLIDHGHSESVADLFTEDGSYGRASGERSVGRDAIRRAYTDRQARGARTARHVFTNLHVIEADAGRARSTSILTLYARDGAPPHPAEPLLVADYDDICRRDADGRWRYQSRTVTWLFRHPGGEKSPLHLGGTEAR